MYCRGCGDQIPVDSIFCPGCGRKLVNDFTSEPVVVRQGDGQDDANSTELTEDVPPGILRRQGRSPEKNSRNKAPQSESFKSRYRNVASNVMNSKDKISKRFSEWSLDRLLFNIAMVLLVIGFFLGLGQVPVATDWLLTALTLVVAAIYFKNGHPPDSR